MACTRRILGAALLAIACQAAGAEQTAPAAATLPASLPLRRDSVAIAEAGSWAPSIALLMLAGAGGAWAWWRRSQRARTGPRTSARAEQVLRLSSQALTPQASVHAVQWRGEELLLACTANQVTVVGRRRLDLQGDKQ